MNILHQVTIRTITATDLGEPFTTTTLNGKQSMFLSCSQREGKH